jgi:hypothetical protein
MTQDRAERTARSLACPMILAVVIVLAAQATTSPQSAAPRGLGFVYDPAQETTMVGNIRGFTSQPASRGLTVRNQRGFLVRNLVSHRGIHDGNPAANGGTR